jgi:hypothetical protein
MGHRSVGTPIVRVSPAAAAKGRKAQSSARAMPAAAAGIRFVSTIFAPSPVFLFGSSLFRLFLSGFYYRINNSFAQGDFSPVDAGLKTGYYGTGIMNKKAFPKIGVS